MTYRKLIAFGRSSHVVCLPKKWVKRNKLSKGDYVQLHVNKHTIILKKACPGQANEKESTIAYENDKQLRKDLIRAYSSGKSLIRITGCDARTVRKHLQRLVGAEILAEEDGCTTARIFVDLDSVEPKLLIIKAGQTISVITAELNEALSYPTRQSISYCDSVRERRVALERMCHLTARHTYFLLEKGSPEAQSLISLLRQARVLLMAGEQAARACEIIPNIRSRHTYAGIIAGQPRDMETALSKLAQEPSCPAGLRLLGFLLNFRKYKEEINEWKNQ